MKNPPTLADACAATMLDKHLASSALVAEFRAVFAKIVQARKFVLDDTMSRYLYDLSRASQRGGLRKRICQIENARQLARLPHPLTWIEFNYRAFIERSRELGHKLVFMGTSAADVCRQQAGTPP